MAANRIVTGKDLEARLAVLESRVKRPREGIFGPQSMEWRVNGEAAIFLGAGRALQSQMACYSNHSGCVPVSARCPRVVSTDTTSQTDGVSHGPRNRNRAGSSENASR
jgi:hypothetical protein